jgi:hypothetical protein
MAVATQEQPGRLHVITLSRELWKKWTNQCLSGAIAPPFLPDLLPQEEPPHDAHHKAVMTSVQDVSTGACAVALLLS